MNARGIGVAALISVGLLQPLGFIFGWPALRGLGQAWVASPLPLVFSHFRGLETYSSRFDVRVITRSGRTIEERLTPRNYSLLGGPYQRRNVYGAIAAYGPKLTENHEPTLVNSVLRFGFCHGPLLRALRLEEPVASASIHVTNDVTPITTALEVRCD